MLPLLRYKVKGFSDHHFFVFCFFLNENQIKQHSFNTFRKLGEVATTIVSWENLPKKEGRYPEREIDTQRLQKITDIRQKTNVHYKLGIVERDLDIQKCVSMIFSSVWKLVCSVCFLRLEKFLVSAFFHFKSLYCLGFETTNVCSLPCSDCI
ncbi:hypothetical protein K443DRAFT_87788 [Laccaria amethystina LaAM-08-1]|uniref:Uncharacterized protein n=1 Tax=Laccaria amethystina LaAM-08-1 TaxID=1095629 RepID=A0A0C9YA03_9AGAR|nr:hypothetical protein K443DRAFT_87788 [Laccaria amethystina LaAM-08-1]